MQGEEVTTVSRDKSFQEVCLSWQGGERARESEQLVALEECQ